MKRVLLIALLLGSVLLVESCDKSKVRMEVVKDCTGTYLRAKSGLDYKVCNYTLLDSYADGTKIKVSYDNLSECFGLLEPSSCETAHVSEGVIEITKIY